MARSEVSAIVSVICDVLPPGADHATFSSNLTKRLELLVDSIDRSHKRTTENLANQLKEAKMEAQTLKKDLQMLRSDHDRLKSKVV